MGNVENKIKLVPLEPDDREQFILDNQRAFKYGAQEEFGMRDERVEEGEEVISRKTSERCIDRVKWKVGNVYQGQGKVNYQHLVFGMRQHFNKQ